MLSTKQVVREKLGKVVELYSNKRGLFLSPTRGLVIYNSETDEFSEPLTKEQIQTVTETHDISEMLFPTANVHTVFGDVYLLLEIMKATGLNGMLRRAFPDKIFYERFLCHLLHGILKDGSRITCDDFISKSFASYFVKDVPLGTLKSDTSFFLHYGRG